MEDDRYTGKRWGNVDLRVGALETEAARTGDEGPRERPFTILFPENRRPRCARGEDGTGSQD